MEFCTLLTATPDAHNRPAHPARKDSPVPAADSDGQEGLIPNPRQVMRFQAFLPMSE
jgi:hypothetical protein